MDRDEVAHRAPLEGVRVLEVSLGVSVVGAGMAASLPGALLRDLGAEVSKVQSSQRSTLDSNVEWPRVWDRGKNIVEVAERDAASSVGALVREADVVFLVGPETAIEQRGLATSELARANPRLIGVRIRPSRTARGAVPDLELLVAAHAGLTTQIRGHEVGRPVFPTLAVGQAGAALSATVGALAGLHQREQSGVGAWAETSFYEGMLSLLPMIVGRVEHHSPTTRLLWEQQGPAESLCYRCADGGYVQLWFGAKGAYEAFLEHMGEPPSELGYNADLMSGAMVERGRRWAARFATHDRRWWLEDLADEDFRCEPVLCPGEALSDTHVREVGLTVDFDDPERGAMTGLGPVVSVVSTGEAVGSTARNEAPWLTGLRVLDLSAYLAGPIAPLVLAEFGADVVKVEPVTGDVHRSMEPMFAAGQRGKRTLALDLKAPDARAVLNGLFRWSDVVHHNSRVGLAERLGYDEANVRAANPGVIYSFASGWGEKGPRALLPLNDQLMQAFSGVEAAQAGPGQPPTFLVWGAVDVTGGWIAACGILAGLFARRRTGEGQRVSSSLLAAGLFLESGAFLAGNGVVAGPVLDVDQRGYGATYRLYEGADGRWLALAIPDEGAWSRMSELLGAVGLPPGPPPLRTEGGDHQPEELLLEAAFRGKDASTWVRELRRAGVPAELAVEVDRTGFVSAIVDDPVNRQLSRVITYPWGDRGDVDQPCFPPRVGPVARPGAAAGVSALGEHTDEVLAEAGFDSTSRMRLVDSGVIPPTR
jgi:crotonobetainyl-CoA:carnitine CoA-transferase CaiB-like acyl-CoA transferase